MRIVLDTNVLVSGLLNPSGVPAAILRLAMNEQLKIAYDARILQEYIEVLNRKKFNFRLESINALIEYIQGEGEYISANPSKRAFVDEDDRMFYEVLDTSEADYLITGNAIHFPNEQRIVSPREYMKIYFRG